MDFGRYVPTVERAPVHTARWGWLKGSSALILALGAVLLAQPSTAWACGGGIICVDDDAPSGGTVRRGERRISRCRMR